MQTWKYDRKTNTYYGVEPDFDAGETKQPYYAYFPQTAEEHGGRSLSRAALYSYLHKNAYGNRFILAVVDEA